MTAPKPLASNRALQVVEPVAEPDDDGCEVEFDWVKHAEDICVTRQDAIACYPNCRGEVVIRQQGGPCDEDSFVMVRHTDARVLADAIMREAEAAAEAVGRRSDQPEVGPPATKRTKPKAGDKTGGLFG